MTNEITALHAAKAKADAAAWEQFSRDGHRDCGCCGGAMLQFDGRSRIAKEAITMGLAYRSGSDVWINYRLPDGIRTQHMEVEVAARSAFRAELEARGFAKAIKRFWTYID